VKTMHPHRVFH